MATNEARDEAQAARQKARNSKLDDAFGEYVRDMVDSGDMPPGIMIGWIAGVAVSHYHEDGSESDGMFVESTRGLNNFMSRGLSESTAEVFADQAGGWSITEFMEDDDDEA